MKGKKKMKTEVTKTEKKVPVDVTALLEGDEDFRAEDLQAPQIVVMQSTSDLVKEGDLNPGDVVRGSEKLVDKKGRLEIVALTYNKKWLVSEHKGNSSRGVFKGLRNMDAGHNDYTAPEADKTSFQLPLNFEVEGVPYKRTKLLEVFCLVKRDLESMPTPCVLWLKGGAYNRVGKGVMSYFAFAKAAGEAPQLRYLSLGVSMRKNDMGSWFEFDVRKEGKVEDKYLLTIGEWYNLVKAKKVTAQQSDDVQEGVKTSVENSEF